MNEHSLFVFHLLATWYLVGLIWTVQVVHYNLFDRVGREAFCRYEHDHTRLITPVVAVPMLIEIGTASGLVIAAPTGFPQWAAWFGLGMVLAIWLSTWFIQMPCHRRLMSGFDRQAYRRLVASNWIRTMLWSARGAMLAYFTLRLEPCG